MNNTTETNYDDMSEMIENSDINKSGCRLITLMIMMCVGCGILFFYIGVTIINEIQKHIK